MNKLNETELTATESRLAFAGGERVEGWMKWVKGIRGHKIPDMK